MNRLAILLCLSGALWWPVAPTPGFAAHPEGSAGEPAIAVAPAREADIEIFVRDGCPHCVEAEAFLTALARERPALRIVVRDVGRDSAALARLVELAAARGVSNVRVPATFVGGRAIVGYSTAARSDRQILDALGDRNAPTAAPQASTPEASCSAQASLGCDAGPDTGAATLPPFEVSILGRRVGLDDAGLPLFTLIVGLLDGLNPCSMWVLILMISLLAPLNDRRRMLAIAGTFVVLQGLAYYAFMAAWLNLFLFIGLSRASEIALGIVALGAGAINLKDAWAFRRGVSLSIPESAKPGIYARMRAILHARNLGAALVATVALSVLVQFVELVCTSGFPALYTRILTLRQLEGARYYGYLLLYNVAYMLDDIVVLAVGVITLSKHRLQENEGRVLKLVSGLTMVALGLYLVAGTPG